MYHLSERRRASNKEFCIAADLSELRVTMLTCSEIFDQAQASSAMMGMASLHDVGRVQTGTKCVLFEAGNVSESVRVSTQPM